MGNNVLYIEDNPDNMMLVQRALEARGYHLLQAMNGLTGVNLAEREEVDLILLDINLPDIDGYEVARRLRAMKSNQRIKIVAVTGWGQEADKQKSRAAGIDVHLVKPVDAAELRIALADNATLH